MKLDGLNNIGNSSNISPNSQPLDKASGQDKISKNKSFADFLEKSLGEVNKLQNEADKAIEELSAGDVKDVHGTMIALKKADISLQLMMQVRNKIIDAYQEIMRMQI